MCDVVLHWREHAKRRLPGPGVVEDLQAFKERVGELCARLPSLAVELLAEHLGRTKFVCEDERVFGHPDLGSPLDLSKLTRTYLKPALMRAGITKPCRACHNLRYTALNREVAAGNPLVCAQMKAGHFQSQITERYTHPAQVMSSGAAAKGEAQIFALTDDQRRPGSIANQGGSARLPGPSASRRERRRDHPRFERSAQLRLTSRPAGARAGACESRESHRVTDQRRADPAGGDPNDRPRGRRQAGPTTQWEADER